MSPAPLVSIVTVCLDAAPALPSTLASVREQDHPAIEHIVVDGGSTDGTLEVLRGSPDLSWTSGTDAGIADAFNKGIARATGAIIGILNAGDRYTPGAVARAVQALQDDPEAGFAFGHLRFCRDGLPIYEVGGDADYARVIHRWMPALNHPTVFVRRQVYERYGSFDTGLHIAMDYDFLLRIHRAGVRGVLVDAVQAEMAMGGVSERCIFAACRETRRVARRHGRPAFPALLDEARCVLRHGPRRWAGEAARRLGLKR